MIFFYPTEESGFRFAVFEFRYVKSLEGIVVHILVNLCSHVLLPVTQVID